MSLQQCRVLATATKHDFKPTDLHENVTSFLTGDIINDEHMYVIPPRDHPDADEYYWKLKKSMYDLVDSLYNFAMSFDSILTQLTRMATNHFRLHRCWLS